MGYKAGGLCGYIATGILLFWFDEAKGIEEAVHDFPYLNKTHTGFRNGDFTSFLRLFGSSNATIATGSVEGHTRITDVLRLYGDIHNLSISTVTGLGSTKGQIRDLLASEQSPVLVFGSLTHQQNAEYYNHAVTAYGYDSQGNIRVHYGWADYNSVTLNSQYIYLGSVLAIRRIGVMSVPVNDVETTHWSYKAVQYCIRNRLIYTSNGNFSGSSNISRGAFVNALYQLAGRPERGNVGNMYSTFTNFNASSANHDAAVWAYNSGILKGTSSTVLGLTRTLTREQAAVFLQRYSNSDDLNCSFANTSGPAASTFSDYSTVSQFARASMDWATRRKLIKGNTSGLLTPQASLSRAEAAQLVYNFARYARRGPDTTPD